MLEVINATSQLKKYGKDGMWLLLAALAFWHFDSSLSELNAVQSDKRLAVLETEMKIVIKKLDRMEQNFFHLFHLDSDVPPRY